MTEQFAGLTLRDLDVMLTDVLRSDPPPEDADFLKRLCNEIARREKDGEPR